MSSLYFFWGWGGGGRAETGREFLDLKLKKRRADTQAKRLFRLGEKMESLHLQPFVLFDVCLLTLYIGLGSKKEY